MVMIRCPLIMLVLNLRSLARLVAETHLFKLLSVSLTPKLYGQTFMMMKQKGMLRYSFLRMSPITESNLQNYQLEHSMVSKNVNSQTLAGQKQ